MPPGLCYGRSDIPLRPGWQDTILFHADAIAAIRPVRVLSSPAGRCLQPAATLARRLGIPLQTDHALLELDFGRWEMLPWDRVPRDMLDRWAADPLGFAPSGGESGASLLARTRLLAGRLLRDRAPLLIVAHGGPLRLLPSLLRGVEPDLLASSPAQGSLSFVKSG